MIVKRISKIVSVIPAVNTLIDVGCDHGKIGIEAIQTGKAQQVYFTDISTKCLSKAQNLAEKRNMGDRCVFTCGFGMCGIVADCACIAGLGGLETLKIIDNSQHKFDWLVLNPQRNVKELRKQLQKDYFFIYDEIFFDKKFYNIMLLKKGGELLSEMQIKYGKTNLQYFRKDFCDYLFEERAKCVTILNKVFDEKVKQRLSEIDNLLCGRQYVR